MIFYRHFCKDDLLRPPFKKKKSMKKLLSTKKKSRHRKTNETMCRDAQNEGIICDDTRNEFPGKNSVVEIIKIPFFVENMKSHVGKHKNFVCRLFTCPTTVSLTKWWPFIRLNISHK